MVKLKISSANPTLNKEKLGARTPSSFVKVRFVKWGLRIFSRSRKNLAMVANCNLRLFVDEKFVKVSIFLIFYASLQ